MQVSKMQVQVSYSWRLLIKCWRDGCFFSH